MSSKNEHKFRIMIPLLGKTVAGVVDMLVVNIVTLQVMYD
jgi:hypothetical protein